MLYAAAGRRSFPALGPAGQPLDVYDRIADLPNTVAVKVSQPVSLTSTLQLAQRVGDRLSLGPVNLDFLPLLAREVPIAWSGQWNAEAIQTPDVQIGNRMLAAADSGDFAELDRLAVQIEPVLSHFFGVQAPIIRKGAHPWQHNRYYQWLGGGNGGLLPRDPHAPDGAIPDLTASARKATRAAFARSGLTPTDAPDEQFVVGRASWARGVRPEGLKELPYYTHD
jgi:4-hydroxy-tetrahydrodipicolinate synthase